jgi:spore coat protein CotH
MLPFRTFLVLTGLLLGTHFALAQPGGFPGGPPGGGFGPPGGMMGQTRKILKDHDQDGDGRLNSDERKLALIALKKTPAGGRPGGGFGFPGGGGPTPTPGLKVNVANAKIYPDAKLFEPTVLRTLFLDFDNKDWEAELEAFHATDVEVPCTLTVDGKAYPNVGVHFRGMSSYMMVRAGSKRSLNLSMDHADPKQRLHGNKSLNLLNGHEDPTFLSTVLYSQVARQFIPTPQANLVKVVINGENWGVYTNAQQFNKEFLAENFKSTKGARWKVRGNPGGRGGMEYLGDKIDDYKKIFEIKSNDDAKSWKALIQFCKLLNETPTDQLEAVLKPICDLDGLLWFLALDVALINGDGFWTRASDYSLYLDDTGKFHFIPHDMNEAFHPASGPGGFGPPPLGVILPAPLQNQLKLTEVQKKEAGAIQTEIDAKLEQLLTVEQRKQWNGMKANPFGGGGAGSRGIDLDPMVGFTDARKPLRSKVLAVPKLRTQYLANVKTIAEKSLDWKTLGPIVAGYRKLIEQEIEADTKKLETFEAFQHSTADDATKPTARDYPLRAFADLRRKYLLDYKYPAEKK